MRPLAAASGVVLLLLLCAAAVETQTPRPPSYSPALRTPELSCKAFDVNGREIPRSWTRRQLFVKMTGGDRKDQVVNHIVPLACGGCDVPSNMEWMSVAEWKGRTGPERYDCGRHPGGEW